MMIVNEKNESVLELEYYKSLKVINQDSIPKKERFILSRILGHPEIKGSE